MAISNLNITKGGEEGEKDRGWLTAKKEASQTQDWQENNRQTCALHMFICHAIPNQWYKAKLASKDIFLTTFN